MGFLEVKPEILRTFLKNSGKIFRPFFGIFVARPIPGSQVTTRLHIVLRDLIGSLLCLRFLQLAKVLTFTFTK